MALLSDASLGVRHESSWTGYTTFNRLDFGSRTLGPGEAVGGPAERMPVSAQDGVLLFHTKPWVLVSYHSHDLFTGLTEVGF